MNKKRKKGKKKKVIIAISIASVILIIGAILGFTLDMGDVDVVDFGPLAHLDPIGYGSDNPVVFDIADAHDAEHTTYRVVVNGLKISIAFPFGAFLDVVIMKDGTTDALKQWYIFALSILPYMSNVEDGYYTHLEFEGVFDIVDADTSTTYIIQLTARDSVSESFTIYKYFVYEENVLYEMPEVLLDTKDVSFTDSNMHVSFSVDNYEHVTSITGFFTSQDEIIKDIFDNPLTFGFTHFDDDLYEGEYDLSLLPKNDMFLELKVFYLDEDGYDDDFIVEEFEELLLHVDYYLPEVLIETRVIDFVDPVLSVSFSVNNYEHVTGIVGFFEIDEERVVDEGEKALAFSFVHNTEGFYTSEYNTQYLPEDVNISVCLQVTYFDEDGQEDFFDIINFAMITSDGEVESPTPIVLTASIPVLTVIGTTAVVVTIMIIKRKRTNKVM